MTLVAVAEPGDIPAWLELTREVEPLFGPMVNDPNFQAVLQRNIGRGTAFCVREANGPVGAPLLGGLLCSFKPPVHVIGWLAVTHGHRRSGIGQALVEHFFDTVITPAELIVTTFGDDHPAGEPALRFYQHLGFRAAGPAPDGPDHTSRQILRRVLEPSGLSVAGNRRL